MIETDKRKAIYLLHQEGMQDQEIARRLGVSPTSVRTIIQQQGVMPRTIRKDKQAIDPELLRRLHQDCQGRVQRMHEKLVEESLWKTGARLDLRLRRLRSPFPSATGSSPLIKGPALLVSSVGRKRQIRPRLMRLAEAKAPASWRTPHASRGIGQGATRCAPAFGVRQLALILTGKRCDQTKYPLRPSCADA